MSNSKKLLIVFAVILAVGATPLFAELDGTWEGYGDGSCYAPDGTLIYPWQTWYGDVLNGTFEGVWEDWDGNYGDFHGGIIYFYTPVEPPPYVCPLRRNLDVDEPRRFRTRRNGWLHDGVQSGP